MSLRRTMGVHLMVPDWILLQPHRGEADTPQRCRFVVTSSRALKGGASRFNGDGIPSPPRRLCPSPFQDIQRGVRVPVHLQPAGASVRSLRERLRHIRSTGRASPGRAAGHRHPASGRSQGDRDELLSVLRVSPDPVREAASRRPLHRATDPRRPEDQPRALAVAKVEAHALGDRPVRPRARPPAT